MITITATNLLAHEVTTVEAKSISGAWNEICKIRDQFKDLQKIREKAMARMNEKEEETEDYPDQGEEYMEKDLALSAL